MSDPDEESDRIFMEAMTLERPLQDRLDFFCTRHRALAPRLEAAYGELVSRLTGAGAGSDAPDVGDPLPDFLLPDFQGRLVRLDDLASRGPVVVSLNRGHWCDYCLLELHNLAVLAPRIERYGARIISITPERQRFARQLKIENNLPFSVMVDLDNAYAMSLGLVTWIGEEIKAQLLRLDIDISEFQGDNGWFLPIPATFVIGPARTIAARFVDPDFRQRMSNEAILEGLDRLSRKD